jgi:NADH-quinone oxidoreductase subunit N
MENSFFNIVLFPEIALSIATVILLLIGLFQKKNSFKNICNLSILTLIVISFLVFLNIDFALANYNDFFINSAFIQFFKGLIIIGSLATIIITKNYFIELKLSRFEIPILILFSILGMMVLISSNDLIAMYLGIELQSLALYVVATIKRDSLQSSESGVKYFVLGALSSGILLYGCSLIYGFTGSTNFQDIQNNLGTLNHLNLGLIFGLIFVLVGLAFKVSAVPFHMWTPDVYEGAPTSITAFFAIVPKVAAVALIFRFCLEPFKDFYSEWSQIIIFLSIASMFLGSIAAIAQTSIKRLLAYSSIGHVGYILIGLASSNAAGIKGVVIYMLIYVLMNVAIFTIILSLKFKDNYVEKISDLSGLSKNKPVFSICIAITMLSMAGIPPLAGFFGKFYIFIAALEAKLFYLAILGALFSVVSAFYYLRIIKIMYFEDLKITNYQTNISSKASLILFFSIITITMFIFYPSLIINIGSDISIEFFNN